MQRTPSPGLHSAIDVTLWVVGTSRKHCCVWPACVRPRPTACSHSSPAGLRDILKKLRILVVVSCHTAFLEGFQPCGTPSHGDEHHNPSTWQCAYSTVE